MLLIAVLSAVILLGIFLDLRVLTSFSMPCVRPASTELIPGQPKSHKRHYFKKQKEWVENIGGCFPMSTSGLHRKVHIRVPEAHREGWGARFPPLGSWLKLLIEDNFLISSCGWVWCAFMCGIQATEEAEIGGSLEITCQLSLVNCCVLGSVKDCFKK